MCSMPTMQFNSENVHVLMREKLKPFLQHHVMGYEA